MKILAVIALLITMNSLLLSCKETIQSPQASETPIDVTTTVDRQTTTSYPDSSPVSFPSQAFYDYDEYLNWLDSADYLPETFIPYETLSFIGTFDGVVCLSNTKFMYTFIDANGAELYLYVYLNVDSVQSDSSVASPILAAIDLTDMRFYPNQASGAMTVGDLEYYYIKGKLNSIKWRTDTARFTLCARTTFGDYPIEYEHDTFASKMLIQSEVQNALNALPDSVYQKSAK